MKKKRILCLAISMMLGMSLTVPSSISASAADLNTNEVIYDMTDDSNTTTETKFGFEHEGDGDTFAEEANVGAEIGFTIIGLKDGESVTYSLSDEEVAKIANSDNKQVTVSCLKEGKTVLTAKSSDGQSFDVEITVKAVDTEPIAIEGTPNEEVKFGFEHEGDGDTFAEDANVGAEIGFTIIGLKDGESVTYSLSDEEVAKIANSDNKQVTVSCLKEGKTVLTAKSSDGQSFDVEITVKAVATDPVPSDDSQLPQTGYSDIYKVIAGLAALMTVSGAALVVKTRKENE